MVFGAVEAMRAGTYIFPAFDLRLGIPAIGQTMGLLLVGGAFACAGSSASFFVIKISTFW
jgi:hypothetical protein